VGERLVAEAEPGQCLCLFGAHGAELLAVAGLFEQPLGSIEVAQGLFPCVFEAAQLAAEAVAVGELAGIVEC
jgi:hypothetical protein